MQMERLHTDGNIGHQVVGGVRKINKKGEKLFDRVGVKRSGRRRNSHQESNQFDYSAPWWGSIADRIRQNQIHLDRWIRKQPVLDLLDLLAESREVENLTAVLGKDRDGRSVHLNFSYEDVQNILIAGEQGSGKSNLIRSLLLGLAINNHQRNLQMVIIESRKGRARWGAHGNGCQLLGSLPHALAPLAASSGDIQDTISLLEQELDYRKEMDVTRPLIFVAIDDFDRLLCEIDEALKRKVIRLLQEGADAGMRIVLAMRRIPESELLPILRLNFPVRLIGRMRNKGLLRQLAGQDYRQIKELDSVVPLSGSGQFVAIAHGHTLPFTAAYIDDYDTYTVATTLHRQQGGTIIAQPRRTNNDADQSTGDGFREFDASERLDQSASKNTPTEQSYPNFTDWEHSSRELLEVLSLDDEDRGK